MGERVQDSVTGASSSIQGWWEVLQGYLPDILKALLILVIGWIIAKIVGAVIKGFFNKTGFGKKMGAWMDGGSSASVGHNFGKGGYWLVMLFTLVAFFQQLNLTIVTEPITGLLNTVMEFLPRIAGAVILFFVAKIIATVLKTVVQNLLSSFGLDERLNRGTDNVMSFSMSSGISDAIYYLIFILFLPAILGALQMGGMLAPVQGMVDQILALLPKLFAAGVLLAIAFFIGRLIANLLTSLLSSVGFNNIVSKLGFNPGTGAFANPSKLVSYVVHAAIMIVAAMEASHIVGFSGLSDILQTFLGFGGQVLFGVIILGLGLFLANLAADAVRASGGKNSGLMANIARWAILLLTGSMALSRMGVGGDIIQIAFTALIAALAVAFMLAFGLGGRDAAAEVVKKWKANIE